MARIPSVKEVDLKGKKVLIRIDHNVVKKGKIKDTYRIDASLPTIKFVLKKGGKPILMSHVGRPKNKNTGEIIVSEATSVKPIVEYLNKKIGKTFKVALNDKPDFKDKTAIEKLKEGEIDGVYLPNTRWFAGEEAKDEKAEGFAKELADLADVFVNDAFGSWQPHASTFLVTKYLPSFAGLLMIKEIDNLAKVLDAKRPFVAVVAGSKFDTKIGPLTALLTKADHLIIGGVIYNAYLCAKYDIRIEGISEEDIQSAQSFIDSTREFSHKILEIPLVLESDILEKNDHGKTRIRKIADFQPGMKLNYILDAAPQAFETEEIKKIFADAETFFVNAVMGFTPNFSAGSKALYSLINENRKANKLFGGGDTLQDFKLLLPQIHSAALDDDKYYFFTGGGTILKAIQEGTAFGLEPVKALIEK
ncbi:MAG: phosphoglycerate kinase [Candidatus Cloacimonetes bacterium]|nr:phosphoglycerate kinase [Candidatus Cloacimonadota bacterium]MCF7815212.1 phosphoglycerate kinase [Candidatus Cloacimonadota bacterium]MCF7869382.1 phosphoglycerate kinase [Candidatus Cloacimonadota bacterium]